MTEQHAILQRARELAVQAANDVNVSIDRGAISEELVALEAEFSRITAQTEFNTQNLLSGQFQNKNLQVGANCGQNITISISSTTMAKTSNKVDTYGNATQSIKDLDVSIETLSKQRSQLGALQNRLEYAIRNADNTAENLQSAESRIRDVNMAKEMTKYSKDSILQQAGQSMLAQANQSTQGVLALLR
jgi:flagellin